MMKYCYESTICIKQFVNFVMSFFWLLGSAPVTCY